MEIERYSKLFSYRQQMINDTEFDVGLDCIRCGEKRVGIDQIGGLTLQGHGGYADFIDTAFEEEARICHLCHECAHKFLLWIGRRSPAWINSIGTTSHPRNTCKRNCDIDHNCFTKGYTKSWSHHGWDNRNVRGFISAIVYYFRLAGWRGVRYVIASLLTDRQNYIEQNLDWLNHLLREIATDKDSKYTLQDVKKAELRVREAKQWKW
tara:strand:- start:16 stop:639 length:624 start_codon:yes stop_codon:yes gene_type:complete